MQCCVSTDVGTWKNRLTFEPDPDHSPDAEIGFLSPTATRQSGVLLRREHRRRKERKSGRACEALRVEAGWGFWERELASIPPARGLRSIVSSPPAGSRAEPQRKLIFVQFLVWRLPLAATTCTLFQVILCR